MTTVTAGSKLLVRGARVPLVLRTLREVDLDAGWSVPVLGDLAALEEATLGTGTAVVEFPTQLGPVRLDAEVVELDGSFVLRAPGLRAAALIEQRRENVRGMVRLPIRGTILTAPAPSTRSQAIAEHVGVDDETPIDLLGITRTVSGGGISAELTAARGVGPGARIYVELRMPGGDLAPAVMTVLDHIGPQVRARFVDISPLDRERLVRLVFARQRAELAERRRAVDSAR